MNKTKATRTKPKADRTKLKALILGTARQKAEIASLRRQIAKANSEIRALSSSPSYRRLLAAQDQRIAALEIGNRIALRAAGLLPSKVVLDITPAGAVTNPAEAYAAAIEAGDKAGAADIFKAHKAELFKRQ
jgi:hypothetical protein